MTASRKSRENLEIREFILRAIPDHPVAVGSLAAEKFGLSRTSANRYLKRLEAQGLVTAGGKTSARSYALKPLVDHRTTVAVTPSTSESEVWRREVEAYLKNVPANVENICHYGFTEMFNNVIDHSASRDAIVSCRQDFLHIEMRIIDHGVGIFEKIRKDFGLDDPRSALLELSKGKLTSDSSKHSGEGIFFTSRMFNSFSIRSGRLTYQRRMTDDKDWLIEKEEKEEYTKGTQVMMTIASDATWTAREVFEKHQNEDMDFAKTQVPAALGQYGREQLVSRSQAKRLLARFESFEEVLLDFQGVEEIGQAFADEIFRVFARSHPKVKITAANANDAVKRMIAHARTTDPTAPGTPSRKSGAGSQKSEVGSRKSGVGNKPYRHRRARPGDP